MNLTPGGLLGYCSSNCMTSLNVPSSNGVSAGPMITAFLRLTCELYRREGGVLCTYHVMTLSAIGDAETPAGGSVCIRYDEDPCQPCLARGIERQGSEETFGNGVSSVELLALHGHVL